MMGHGSACRAMGVMRMGDMTGNCFCGCAVYVRHNEKPLAVNAVKKEDRDNPDPEDQGYREMGMGSSRGMRGDWPERQDQD